MKRRYFLMMMALGALTLTGCPSSNTGAGGDTAAPATGDKPAAAAGDIKIGFVVKDSAEPWFQTEWKFAEEASKKYGFQLIKIEAKDAEGVDSAINNIAAQGAKGLIICTPDTKLGNTIVAKCKEKNIKLLTVDDRLLGPDGKPLTDIPYLGISAPEIGKSVGEAIAEEAKKRGWNLAEVGAAVLTVDEIETCKQRTDGASEALKAAGLPEKNFFLSAWKKPQQMETAVNAANIILTQHPEIKKWVAYSSNDDGVLGFVRATEQKSIAPENVIGIGINGTSGKDDLKKAKTGFHASVLLSARTHGFSTAEAMYNWIKDGKEPAKETYTKGTLIDRANFVAKLKEEGIE
jgi:L-arabinose transport system substrate-binding protein